MRRFVLVGLGLIVGLGILALAGVGAVTVFRRLTDAATSDTPPTQAIYLPDGFVAEVYADPAGAELPSVIAFGPDEQLYLMTNTGRLFRLEDQDGDHVAENVVTLFDNSNNLLRQSVGLTWDADGVMYISDSGRISTFEDSDGDRRLDRLTPIAEGLPSLQFPDHSNNGIAFGPDGKLYVGVGATTDHGPLQEEYEASILRMNPDGSDLEVFASGLRNPYDIVFSPDGALFTADNNPSEFGEMLRYLPPEELNHIRQGEDYGFPDVYGFAPPGSGTADPITEFYASVGSAGITYYSADAFPPEWRNGVYVAQWGTGANIALDRGVTNGQMIVFTPLTPTSNGTYEGDWTPFMVFDLAFNLRPVDVTLGPDGALYVLEFQTGTVYRVQYTGEVVASAPPTETPTPEPLPEFSADLIAQGGDLFRTGAAGAPACFTCHLEAGQVGLGPSLYGLRDRAGSRVRGLNAVEYVRQSIIAPNDYVVQGFNANYMFPGYGEVLSGEQIDALVAYVLSLEE